MSRILSLSSQFFSYRTPDVASDYRASRPYQEPLMPQTSQPLRSNPTTDYLMQRLTEIYGVNVYTALLIGARARGGHGRNAPYDVVLFLKKPYDPLVEHERIDLLASDLGKTFSATFNIYPFPAAAFKDDRGNMKAIRAVGVPLMPLPPDAGIQKQLTPQAEYILDRKDVVCVRTICHPSDCGVATYDIYAASVRSGKSMQWSVPLPYSKEAEEDEDIEDSLYNVSPRRAVSYTGNYFEDPRLTEAAVSLFKFLCPNKLVSDDPEADSGFLHKALRTYHDRIRIAEGDMRYGRVKDYQDFVVNIANSIQTSLPEVALCKAELNAVKQTANQPTPAKSVRHQAEVIRHLLNIN